MDLLHFTKNKIGAVITLIEANKGSDFPYEHSKDALIEIEKIFQARLDSIDRLSIDTDPTVVKTSCRESLSVLAILIPFLGFVTRSSDVRNAFELYGPLLRLTHLALGPGAKLVTDQCTK